MQMTPAQDHEHGNRHPTKGRDLADGPGCQSVHGIRDEKERGGAAGRLGA